MGKDVEANFLSRVEVARRLGISVAELRKRQARGEISIAKVSPRGEVLYRVKDVEKLYKQVQKEARALVAKGKRQRAGFKLDAPAVYFSAEQSSAAFQAFKDGLSPIEVVIKHGIAPQAVQYIAEKYAELSGSVFLHAADLFAINKMPLDGPLPIRTSTDVVEVFETMLNQTCQKCEKHPRQVCRKCYAKELKRELKDQEERLVDGDLDEDEVS